MGQRFNEAMRALNSGEDGPMDAVSAGDPLVHAAADLLVKEAPLAVIDFETTGVNPPVDRVLDVSIVRVEPGCQPNPVLKIRMEFETSVRITTLQ